MKISVEEVSRILAIMPTERKGSAVQDQESSPADSGAADSLGARLVAGTAPAQEVREIKRLVNELPDVREDRVQALKAQIDSGNYHVSGEEIADLIIRRTLADNTAL